MKKGQRIASTSRSRARERALQALYQIDLAAAEVADALATAWKAEEQAPDSDALSYAEDVVRGVQEHQADIDKVIEKYSHHWRVDRMAKVDRNILRLAVYELLHRTDVPRKVVLNEAVELAKRFGSEESSAFINGVLDKVAPSESEGG